MNVSVAGRVTPLVILLALLPGCSALNPFCGSARPVPIISSISPDTIPFFQVLSDFDLTVNGSKFVASSAVVFNGTTLATTVNSSTKLTVTITPAMISGPGTFNVSVHTPSGTSGDIGCSSGGSSSALVLTIT